MNFRIRLPGSMHFSDIEALPVNMKETASLNRLNHPQLLIPLLGIGLFFILYIFSAFLYPGGSNVETISTRYSLVNNYWCDLMANYSKNGHINPARPIAITAWVILCFSLSLFWINLPRLFSVKNINQKIIQYAGTSAMFFALFSFSKFHDAVINLAGILGVITLIPTFIELKKEHYTGLFGLALFCAFLGLLNYFIYTTHFQISKLPLLQKVTYFFCLLTFGAASYKIYLKEKKIKNEF